MKYPIAMGKQGRFGGVGVEIGVKEYTDDAIMQMPLEDWVPRVKFALKGRCLLEEEAYRCFLDEFVQGENDVDILAIPTYEQFYDIVRYLAERNEIEWKPAILRNRAGEATRCERCGSSGFLKQQDCGRCDGLCWICEACITMGRSRSCERLVIGAPPEPQPVAVPWYTRAVRFLQQSAAMSYKAGAKGWVQHSVARLRGCWDRRRGLSVPGPASMSADSEGSGIRGTDSKGLALKEIHIAASATENKVSDRKECEESASRKKIESEESMSREIEASMAAWSLSEPQMQAVREVLTFLRQTLMRKFLLWAVCGAGKTEVLFPALQWAEMERRRTGGEFNVLVATPRRDVVLELEPRLKKAFLDFDWTVLHGASEHRWKRTANTLATTHQVMRFAKRFDLIVVDEVDAYPFENNPMLYYAVERALKPKGKVILLSATPSIEMQRLVRKGKLPYARIAERFHGHPLPLPELVISPFLRRNVERDLEDRLLHQAVNRSLGRGAQIFLFVPTIKDVDRMLHYIKGRKWLGKGEADGTHSKDPNRGDKVMAFRNHKLRLLVTTTILERGVTVPRSDVIVWEADSALYSMSALVQMAGRVGRSKDDPKGHVQFICSKRSREAVLAIRQIKDMNRYARISRDHE